MLNVLFLLVLFSVVVYPPTRQIVYGIFLPSLLMVNVAKTCISQPVTSLLPIPVFAAIQIGVGFVISTVALRVLKIDPDTEVGREAKVGYDQGWGWVELG